MDAKIFQCENCGAELPRRFEHARMIGCTHCGSTSILKDEVFRLAGEGGVLLEAPALIELGREVKIERRTYMPVGHAQFDYGRGHWDEFWCTDGNGDGWWISADEGDYALEQALDPSDWPENFRPALGSSVVIGRTSFAVTEAENATCTAVRGEFPEDLSVGETHLYFDLNGGDGKLATYEKWDGGEGWSVGKWVNPWDVSRA